MDKQAARQPPKLAKIFLRCSARCSHGVVLGPPVANAWSPNLAIMRAASAHDVLLVDADDQETSADFTVLRNASLPEGAGYTCIKLTGPAVRTEVARLSTKYDDIIIDAGGRDTVSQRAALVLADVLLVPFVPRSFDIWTLDTIITLIQEIRTINPELRTYAFINRGDASGTDNLEAASCCKRKMNWCT